MKFKVESKQKYSMGDICNENKSEYIQSQQENKYPFSYQIQLHLQRLC